MRNFINNFTRAIISFISARNPYKTLDKIKQQSNECSYSYNEKKIFIQ